ncbi:hypothetical protein CVT24_001187 [Panaeolus cyanescens]|uniref:NAD(P)-binding protein n=1 Tax=Panaeolus cyanescens TaxID=181874 RepID=A0A409X0U4_9AGAR|nr:hypothetical protein CVT24_001187 [Panaeolus cyanescens]
MSNAHQQSNLPNAPTCIQSIISASTSASSQPTRTAFSQFSLLGRTALVTGARRGLGLEYALVLAEAGAVVYCMDVEEQAGEEWEGVRKWVEGLGELGEEFGGAAGRSNEKGEEGKRPRKGRMEYVCGDIRDKAGVENIVERIVEVEGGIDVCVANAAIMGSAPCLEYEEGEMRKIIDTNVMGTLFTAQAVGKQMERLGIRGSIILMASLAGSVACKGIENMAYSICKAAVIQMARSMASELGSKGIRVNSVSPSYTMTAMVKAAVDAYPALRDMVANNPLQRIAMPEELRGVMLWLASDAGSFMTGRE